MADDNDIPCLTGWDRDHDIRELTRVISLGHDNADALKKVLQDLQRDNAITESYYADPALKHLPKAVIKRIVWLDSLRKKPECAADIVNIDAVRKAYIDGQLEIRPGHSTFWAGGRQKTDYITDPMTIGRDPNAVWQQWVKEEGGDRVWWEDPREPLPQMAGFPFPGFLTHDVPVLDDTGSTYLEVFDVDRLMLAVPLAIVQANPSVWLNTVGGPVQRHLLVLEAQLLDQQQNPIRGRVFVITAVDPGNPNRMRCSGMLVRKNFFTATAPNRAPNWQAQGLLHVAEKKNGIVSHLPVV